MRAGPRAHHPHLCGLSSELSPRHTEMSECTHKVQMESREKGGKKVEALKFLRIICAFWEKDVTLKIKFSLCSAFQESLHIHQKHRHSTLEPCWSRSPFWLLKGLLHNLSVYPHRWWWEVVLLNETPSLQSVLWDSRVLPGKVQKVFNKKEMWLLEFRKIELL